MCARRAGARSSYLATLAVFAVLLFAVLAVLAILVVVLAVGGLVEAQLVVVEVADHARPRVDGRLQRRAVNLPDACLACRPATHGIEVSRPFDPQNT